MRTSFSADLRLLLRQQSRDCAYPGYVYGYPHKKAYRLLDCPLPLREVWQKEDRDHLFCYVHIPFCGQRCSFCNLFTHVPGEHSPTADYLTALAREMALYARELAPCRFTRLYVGGGTPTYLNTAELVRLVELLKDHLGVDPARTHGCVEASPETVDADKVGVLKQLGFQRISLGVQSFQPEELQQVNRRFDFALHRQAIDSIGRARFAHFNIDLIYGLPGQTLASWRASVEQALDSPATSLFLYPLYVRPLTGLAVKRRSLDISATPSTHDMAAMYDWARERLATAGFEQVTMRQFRRDATGDREDSEYRCQEHGMIGLGAGARSYTRELHYSTPWRMLARNIRAVIDDYQQRLAQGRAEVWHGFQLDVDEQQRRFIIQSLLYDGLDTRAFARMFHDDARQRFSEVWEALLAEGCVAWEQHRLRLTRRGTRHADIVGQLFFSPRVVELIAAYEYDT